MQATWRRPPSTERAASEPTNGSHQKGMLQRILEKQVTGLFAPTHAHDRAQAWERGTSIPSDRRCPSATRAGALAAGLPPRRDSLAGQPVEGTKLHISKISRTAKKIIEKENLYFLFPQIPLQDMCTLAGRDQLSGARMRSCPVWMRKNGKVSICEAACVFIWPKKERRKIGFV